MKRTGLLFIVAACGGSSPSVQRVAYPNGRPHFEFELKSGVPDGIGRTWYASGALKSEGRYAAGAKHGRFTFFTEDAAFEYQAVFRNNVEVWRSTESDAEPPEEIAASLAATSLDAPARPAAPDLPPELVPRFTGDKVPAPYFATLDRTTSLSRVGAHWSSGSTSALSFGAISRYEVFGNYRFERLGIYAQASQAVMNPGFNMQLVGRQTFELGGTYHQKLVGLGQLTLRGGLLVPLGHDDSEGYIAGSFGAYQRAADAVEAFPSSAAVRSSASFTHRRQLFVFQGDVGVDWVLGGPERSIDAVLRADAGVGFGIRAVLLTFEVANSVRASDVSRRIDSFATGTTVWFDRLWLTGSLSISQEGTKALIASAGYEL